MALVVPPAPAEIHAENRSQSERSPMEHKLALSNAQNFT
ncbi:hypothetical protein PPTG_24042 [Phytophthora nicotianae INRA-310]|uniref:Uncharacterized protein n=1 Tax=Phytophthora nicotianae (strain INRA-310) TaxID=761204 RepID=W2PMY1_PHYN3|nr:hypothetical protein PPTG_24042 [Phytophthora nicotianae INRA-310]ETN01614.1 hypothetical protein PPTG_24042 [Phytophthora nicotianae INRA-310]